MRQLWMLLLVTSLASLPACAMRQTEATSPTVSYAFDDEDDYDQIAEKTEDYCADEYGREAVLVDQDTDDGDYEATFACE